MLLIRGSFAILTLGLSGMAVMTPAPESHPASAVHFGLARSVPPADSTVQVPQTSVELWFTEKPRDGSVSVRITDAAEEPVPTGASALDPEVPTYLRTPFISPLKPGKYTVHWRGVGADGHVVRGSFSFSVMTAASSPS